MDKAQIHVQHRMSFWEDICALRVDFFRQIYSNQPCKIRPRLIMFTATFPSSYVWLLSTLLTVDLSMDDCIRQVSAQEFCQWETVMKLRMCSNQWQFVAKGLTLVADFLHQNHDSSIVVFCNSWKQSQHFTVHLEKKLDAAQFSIDVLNMNGSLNKIEKFWRIRIFCDNRHIIMGDSVPLFWQMFPMLVLTNIQLCFRYVLNGHAISSHCSKSKEEDLAYRVLHQGVNSMYTVWDCIIQIEYIFSHVFAGH